MTSGKHAGNGKIIRLHRASGKKIKFSQIMRMTSRPTAST